MNRELRAYIEVIVADCGKEKAVTHVSVISRAFRKLARWLTEFLEANGPYYCELRPMRKIRSAIKECCKPKEVIGFHGLV